MFLASALKRGRHPPKNIMKFNVPGGECLSLGHLLRTWPPAISVKTTLRFSHRSETSGCTYSVVGGLTNSTPGIFIHVIRVSELEFPAFWGRFDQEKLDHFVHFTFQAAKNLIQILPH
jgi:hypothetical protein